jgi:2,3-dihydroxybenzoate decarboxylase
VTAASSTPTGDDIDEIALEEHFVIPDFLDYLANAMPKVTKEMYDALVARLSDFGERRLSVKTGQGSNLQFCP